MFWSLGFGVIEVTAESRSDGGAILRAFSLTNSHILDSVLPAEVQALEADAQLADQERAGSYLSPA